MSPRSAEENERIRAQQSERIVLAAARLFARRGLAATKISDVAAAAGVSSGLVHHYFGTKNDLFATLVRDIMSHATEVPQQALDHAGTPWERLEWMVTTMVQGASFAPDYYLVTIQVATSDAVPESLKYEVAEAGAAGMALMARVVAEAQAAGAVRNGDPRALAEHLVAFLQGLALQIVANGSMPGVPDTGVVLGMLKR